MPPLKHSQSSLQILRKFRLEAAKEVLLSLPDPKNISSCELVELCNDHAIQILINWLANKFVFPITLLSEYLLQEFPFSNSSLVNIETSPKLKSWQVLENNLEPNLYLIGNIYEYILDQVLEIDSSVAIHIKKSNKRRLLGQYFTPPDIVKYCYEMVFNNDHFYQSFIDAIKNNSSIPKIMDPACGTGNFLLGALDWFKEQNSDNNKLITLAKHSLYGIDPDARAISLCRLAILLMLSPHIYAMGNNEEKVLHIYTEIFQSLKEHIIISDSLILASSDKYDNKFNLIATNPPYISYGSRNQEKTSNSLYLRKYFPDSTEYKIRLHSIFQDIAIKLACDQGRIALFLPDAFLTGNYYKKLRQKLLNEVRIESFTEFQENVISKATVGKYCVAIYTKTKNTNKNYELEAYTFANPNSVRHLRYSINTFVAKDKNRFRLFFNEWEIKLWQTFDDLPQLKSILHGHTGIRSRHGQKTIIAGSKKGNAWRKGIISGSSVSPYKITWNNTWLNIDPNLLYSGGFDPLVIEHPKLLVRQTADHIIAAFDDTGLYHLNNVHSFSAMKTTHSQVDLHFLTGLFNSKLWLYLYRSKSRERGRALAQIDIEMIESMPIPELDLGKQSIISKLACDFYNCEQNTSDLKDRDLLSLSKGKLDQLVYELYELTSEQISQIENWSD